MYKKKRNKRNKIKKENNKRKNALTRFFCGGGGLFFEHHFCGYPQHGHLRGFAQIISGQTIFVTSRKWCRNHFVDINKKQRSTVFSH